MNKTIQKIAVSTAFLIVLYPAVAGAMEQNTQKKNVANTETAKKTTNEQQPVDFAKLLALYFQTSFENNSCTGCCKTCGGCGNEKNEPKKMLPKNSSRKNRTHKEIDFGN